MIDSDRSNGSSNDVDRYYPIKTIKDSTLQLSLLPSYHLSINYYLSNKNSNMERRKIRTSRYSKRLS